MDMSTANLGFLSASRPTATLCRTAERCTHSQGADPMLLVGNGGAGSKGTAKAEHLTERAALRRRAWPLRTVAVRVDRGGGARHDGGDLLRALQGQLRHLTTRPFAQPAPANHDCNTLNAAYTASTESPDGGAPTPAQPRHQTHWTPPTPATRRSRRVRRTRRPPRPTRPTAHRSRSGGPPTRAPTAPAARIRRSHPPPRPPAEV